MNIYTFDNFWESYHMLTCINKTHKELCKQLWDKTIREHHIKAFRLIQDYKHKRLNAYEYLQEVFKFD